MVNLINCILKTNAIKFCTANKPFWTKKGTLVPYKIDSNLLFGSSNDAIELLDFINLSSEQTNKLSMPRNIFIQVLKQYNTNKKYQIIINNCLTIINSSIGESRIDYVSGIEKDDWFFSLIIAYLLKKPHISIFKDKQAIVTNSTFTNSLIIDDLEGARVLNISSVLNNTNKITKLLIPSLKEINADLCWNFTIINNLKNSFIKLNDLNIEDYSLTSINLITKYAYKKDLINTDTYNLIINFSNKPTTTMKNFLIQYPTFIRKSLLESKFDAKAATICTEKDIYKFNTDKAIKTSSNLKHIRHIKSKKNQDVFQSKKTKTKNL